MRALKHQASRHTSRHAQMLYNQDLRGIVAVLVLLWLFAYANASSEGDTLLSIKDKWKAALPTWTSGTNHCQTWEGVTCNHLGQVSSLSLSNKGLIGPVPDEVGSLVSLTNLDLSNNKKVSESWNQITGDLSPIGSLVNLQSLNASLIPLDSDFPTAILQLTNLVSLRIDSSGLSGSFPAGLSKLSKLKYLYIGNNSMTGNLPNELGRLTNLVELTMWNNSFNSKIPVEMSNLTNLSYLNLHNCGLWGGLPPEFGKLTNMRILYLYENQLTGTIPDSWKNMVNLQEMKLKYNYLTKSIPSWILHHPSLTTLALNSNEFYGTFPDFSNNTRLTEIWLECNFFTGPWPKPRLNTKFFYDGNCFSNITATNDNSKWNCQRLYTCNGFTNVLSGGCPPCPTGQIFMDHHNCVCGFERNSNSGSKSSHVGIIVGVIVAIALLFLIGCFAYYKWRSRPIDSSIIGAFFSVRDVGEYWEVPKGIQKFTFQELAKATSNFHKDHEIGVGGFGKVYVGTLSNGKKVAIKRASPLSLQGYSEFHNEVLLLSRLHHRNLVHLEGFCEDSGFQILVYEYMINGNLHRWLFDNRSEHTLSWYQRLDIAVGIARGLEYLHSFADPPVIHRDVKPSNILLDEHLVAKVADFGLSKATPEFETHVSTTPAGTAGYIDPQYFLRRQLTTASDVYGFGVMLLELITGQKAVEATRTEDQNLVEWVKLRVTPEQIGSIVDPRLGKDYPADVFFNLTVLAVRCAAFNKEERPSMQEVVAILEHELHLFERPSEASLSIDKFADGGKLAAAYRAQSEDLTSGSSEAATRDVFQGPMILPR